LSGEDVTFGGRHVKLAAVQLDQPPSIVPPVVAGVQQEKSLAVAGRVADGVILVEGAGATYVNWALDRAGHPSGFQVITYTMMSIAAVRRDAYRPLTSFVAGLIAERRPALTLLPFFDEMAARLAAGGPQSLVDMPADYWREIGAIGTMDDALGHIAALEDAGVTSINIFPGPELDVAWEQLPQVAALARR
jgi:alkanesulfonate monooxygenase SsuD/methylene tetrahydromethanopterin reductase-like flavin-dependent oxidoreductase (luciferase family)